MKKTYKYILFLGFTFFLCSCGSESSQKISLNDLTKDEATLKDLKVELNEFEDELDQIMADTLIVESVKLKFWQDSLGKLFDFSKGNASSKLDRFELESKEKIQISAKIGVSTSGKLDVFQSSYYQYKDSLHCKTALYNWLDCFGNDCAEIKVNQEAKKLEKKRQLVIVTEKEIYTLESHCGNDVNWSKMKSTLLDQINTRSIKHQFEIGCRGRLKWEELRK